MNKYYAMLERVVNDGREQENVYEINQMMHLEPADLLDIFESCDLTRKKLRNELTLLQYGERSTDASLGLPSDSDHLYLISRQIDLPLRSITLFPGNVHIYENNIKNTRRMLQGEDGVCFSFSNPPILETF